MILIKNKQRKIRIDIAKTSDDVEKILNSLGYEDFDLGIWFTTNQTIKRYNEKYRKKNKPTDILSFPYHSDLKPGHKIKIRDLEDKNLGDLIISLEFAKRSSKEQKRLFSVHLRVLLVHGIVHLLGYSHETQGDYEKMQKIERNLLDLFSIRI